MARKQQIKTYKESITNWDVPNEMIEELKELFQIGSITEINKYMRAGRMLEPHETVEKIDEKGFPFLTIKQTYNYM